MPVATLVVRLSDQAPDGTSLQVTMGVLNLTHRDGHREPRAVVPGEPMRVRVPLRAAGYRFAVGHRIRLSIASACWPVIWPSPFPGTITVHHGGSDESARSRLIFRSPRPSMTRTAPVFRPAPPVLDVVGSETSDPPVWRVAEDVLAGSLTVTTHDGGDSILEGGGRLYAAESHDLTAADGDPAHARMASRVRYVLEREGSKIEVDVDSDTTSDAAQFHLDIRLAVRLDGAPFFERRTVEAIDRDLA